jgi:hypothetical protein
MDRIVGALKPDRSAAHDPRRPLGIAGRETSTLSRLEVSRLTRPSAVGGPARFHGGTFGGSREARSRGGYLRRSIRSVRRVLADGLGVLDTDWARSGKRDLL